MLVLVVFDLLFVYVLASNEDQFDNGWRPIARSDVFSKVRNDYYGTRHASAWKPSQRDDNSDMDNEEAIQIIAPEQAETTQYDETVYTTFSSTAATTNTTSNIKRKDALVPLQHQDQYVPKFQPGHGTDSQRASKQLRSLNLTNLISKPFDKPVVNITSAESEISIIVKNASIAGNNYEVTEPSNVVQLDKNVKDKNLGYIYQPPPVPADLFHLPANANEYTSKLTNLLSKYNIKPQDMLNNYDRSKLHHNHMLNSHPSVVSTLPLVPFRYNCLNHRPVDPLLAVMLSNYGYYLQGFYGLTNNYKNLYGYLASNNIHNNKPFGSYKIYTDF